MTRYPDATPPTYEYRCGACGATVPDFQGLFWFTREAAGDGAVEVPYCPECGATAIERHRVQPDH